MARWRHSREMNAGVAHAEAEASAGLLLLMRGELAAGLARYRAGFSIEHGHRLPAGLHLQLLENAGRRDEAEALRVLAVRLGGNVAIRHVALNAAAGEAATEYEELFARGVVNGRMVHAYLQLLARLGRAAELRRWLAPELLFRTVTLDHALAAEIEQALLAREQAAPFQEAVQSVRKMRMIAKLHHDPNPAVQRLIAVLTKETERYFRDWAVSAHPLAAAVPQRLRLSAWGLVSRGEGSNARHIHPKGLATGIYYPTAVPAGGGALWVGAPSAEGSGADGWFEAEVQPRAGLLVLMPSFYTHWTTRLAGPGLRTSIAFDVRALGADEEDQALSVDAGGVPL